jgi:uncharacterized membrane protein YphA (DoxX/SURF4 family)
LRRYYPGFFGAAFLVLLRIAIGWHLLSEGLYKIMSTPEAKGRIVASAPGPKDPGPKDPDATVGQKTRDAEEKGNETTKGWAFGRYFHPTDGPPFSSESYQRNASGPLAAQFRGMIPDVDSRDALDFAKVKEAWRTDLDRAAVHYGFDDKQKADAGATLAKQEADAAVYFQDPETRDKIKKYLDNLDALARLDAKPNKMSYEVERYYEGRKSLEADRKALVAPVDSWSKALRDAWTVLATDEQEARAGTYRPPYSEVEKADLITMYGLSICGLALMLGLFTPVAGLASAGFLMLFYLSMPPWPGLPVPPNVEGHYVFVNKNLIEFLACLVIAATPSGLWIGVDALLFGWIDRLRARRALRREREEFDRAVREAAGHPETVAVAVPKKSKTR